MQEHSCIIVIDSVDCPPTKGFALPALSCFVWKRVFLLREEGIQTRRYRLPGIHAMRS